MGASPRHPSASTCRLSHAGSRGRSSSARRCERCRSRTDRSPDQEAQPSGCSLLPVWNVTKDQRLEGSQMSLQGGSNSYAMAPDEGEALWFNGALGLLKATTDLTGGRFTALALLAPKGFASPLHIHRAEDEFFVVRS